MPAAVAERGVVMVSAASSRIAPVRMEFEMFMNWESRIDLLGAGESERIAVVGRTRDPGFFAATLPAADGCFVNMPAL
jgi:hypothetical protein